MHEPCQRHLDAVYRILRYLMGTPGKGLLFARYNDQEVKMFTDVDWAESIDDRKSTSGLYFIMGKFRNLTQQKTICCCKK